MPKNIRQLAAIMFTDMVGYTALMQQDEKKAKQLRDRQRSVLEKTIQDFYGVIIQYYGDGTLSVFGSAVDAANCAVKIQQQLFEEPKVPLRIGIHLGDIVYDDDGVYGDGVNVAARIESLSVPGAVLISGKVHDELKNQPEFSHKALGKFNLKNVNQPVEILALANELLTVPEPGQLNGKATEAQKSVAVLPFVNMSNDLENEYFSDGISEELINALVRVDGLRVISRTSSFAFKGKNMDVREIGKELGVDTVLEGSVRKAGNRVRVTAQLINTADGYHFWSEVYDRDLEDIFAVQDEISLNIAGKLRKHISPEEHERHLVKVPTENIEAYNLYLKGLYYLNKWRPETINKAIGLYEQSIALQDDFVLPYSGLAYAYSFMGAMGQMPSEIVFPKAKEAARKALQIDGQSAQSHTAMGLVNLFYDWNMESAHDSFKKAMELGEGQADIHHAYALYLLADNQAEEAINQLNTALLIDPLSIPIHAMLGQAYLMSLRLDEALDHYDRTLELDPESRSALESKGWVFYFKGEYDNAINTLKEFYSKTKDPLKGVTALGFVYAKTGDIAAANECLDKMEKRRERDKTVNLEIDFAIVHLGLGEIDKVFEYLDKAIGKRLGFTFIRSHPGWAEMRDDPRYLRLLEKMNHLKR